MKLGRVRRAFPCRLLGWGVREREERATTEWSREYAEWRGNPKESLLPGTRILFNMVPLDSVPIIQRWPATWPEPSPLPRPRLQLSSLCLCPCMDGLSRTQVSLRLGPWSWSQATCYKTSLELTDCLALGISLFLDVHVWTDREIFLGTLPCWTTPWDGCCYLFPAQ